MSSISKEPLLIYDRIEENRRNTLLLLIALSILLVPFIIYALEYLMLWAAIILSPQSESLVLSLLLALIVAALIAGLVYSYSTSLLLRITGAKEVVPAQEKDLWRITNNLCIGAGLPVPKLHLIETPFPNAFSAGLEPEKANLVVHQGLLALLDRRELEGVIAHELSHIGNYDTRLNTILVTVTSILWLPAWVVIRGFRLLFRIHWIFGLGCLLWAVLMANVFIFEVWWLLMNLSGLDRTLRVVMFGLMVLPFYVFLISPLVAVAIQKAVSRQREFLADADAVLLTRYPEGLARALSKISGAQKTQSGKATVAPLYFVDPAKEGWRRIFSTHPSLTERISILARMDTNITEEVLRRAREEGIRYAQSFQ